MDYESLLKRRGALLNSDLEKRIGHSVEGYYQSRRPISRKLKKELQEDLSGLTDEEAAIYSAIPPPTMDAISSRISSFGTSPKRVYEIAPPSSHSMQTRSEAKAEKELRRELQKIKTPVKAKEHHGGKKENIHFNEALERYADVLDVTPDELKKHLKEVFIAQSKIEGLRRSMNLEGAMKKFNRDLPAILPIENYPPVREHTLEERISHLSVPEPTEDEMYEIYEQMPKLRHNNRFDGGDDDKPDHDLKTSVKEYEKPATLTATGKLRKGSQAAKRRMMYVRSFKRLQKR